jgi:hypothetical protein
VSEAGFDLVADDGVELGHLMTELAHKAPFGVIVMGDMALF